VSIIYFCQTYFNEEISQNFFCFKILGHFNHLYNTILWKLIKIDGQNPHEAYLKLVVCFTSNFISSFNWTFISTFLQNKKASELNEILFRNYKNNYNNEPEVYRKGSLIYQVNSMFKPSFHHSYALFRLDSFL